MDGVSAGHALKERVRPLLYSALSFGKQLQNKKGPLSGALKASQPKPVRVLLSRAPKNRVPLAMQVLTSVFGMGTGVTLALLRTDLGCEWFDDEYGLS